MITVIVIPVDPDEPLRLEQLDEHDVPAYRLVDGDLQLVGLERPRAALYFNEEGKTRQMAFNQRATALLWVHNNAFIGQDVIAGPAFIVGPPDRRGNDTSVPASLVYLLFHATRYEMQVLARGERRWNGNELVFIDWFGAYTYAFRLAYRWTSVEGVRVVPKLDDQLRQTWYRLGLDHPVVAAADEPRFHMENFVACYSIEELANAISDVPPIAGTAFYYCDLCFIRQVNADRWLVIHGTEITHVGMALMPMIEEGAFASLVQRLLSTTKR